MFERKLSQPIFSPVVDCHSLSLIIDSNQLIAIFNTSKKTQLVILFLAVFTQSFDQILLTQFTQIHIPLLLLIFRTNRKEIVTNLTIRPGRTPKSAIAILGALVHEGPMCPLEISETLNMAPRTVSFALRTLLGHKLLRKIPNLNDMRRPKYHALDAARDLLQQYNDSALKSHASPFTWQKKL